MEIIMNFVWIHKNISISALIFILMSGNDDYHRENNLLFSKPAGFLIVFRDPKHPLDILDQSDTICLQLIGQ
jgi:hypothetical protein